MSVGEEAPAPEVNSQEDQPISTSWAWLVAVAIVLLALVLVPLGVIVLMMVDQEPESSRAQEVGSRQSPAVTRESPETLGGYENPKSALTESVATDQAEEHRLRSLAAARRAEWARLRHRADAVEEALDETDRELAAWLKTTGTLDTSADGKRLAADPRLLDEYDALLAQPVTTRKGLGLLREELVVLRSSITDALAPGMLPSEPPDEFREQIDRIGEETQTWLRRYTEGNRHLASLLRRAPDEIAEDVTTLAETLAERETRRRETEMEEMAAALKERRAERAKELLEQNDQADKEIHEAELAAARRLGAQKAESIRRQTEMAVDAEQARLEAEKAEAEAKRLKAEFDRDLPDIRRYLAVFIRKGYAQPAGHRNVHGAELRPVSLGALESSGALEPGRKGQERLMYLASIGNDRYQQDFPLYIGGENGWRMTDKPFLAKAQDLLIKYGPLMVKEELLSE